MSQPKTTGDEASTQLLGHEFPLEAIVALR
jgi:hypothetical protein